MCSAFCRHAQISDLYRYGEPIIDILHHPMSTDQLTDPDMKRTESSQSESSAIVALVHCYACTTMDYHNAYAVGLALLSLYCTPLAFPLSHLNAIPNLYPLLPNNLRIDILREPPNLLDCFIWKWDFDILCILEDAGGLGGSGDGHQPRCSARIHARATCAGVKPCFSPGRVRASARARVLGS